MLAGRMYKSPEHRKYRSRKWSVVILASSMAGNGPEGRVVDQRGVWWTGRASGRLGMSRRGINGPESAGMQR